MSLLRDSDLEQVHKKIINSTIEKCSQFYNARILEAIKIRWLKIYEQKLMNKDQTSEQKNTGFEFTQANANDADFDEDEFEDAEVEEKDFFEFPVQAEDDEVQYAYNHLLCFLSQDELNELDNISISDLSDVDPPTNNVIVGICDKISKPCGRRNASSNWKIKLKGGLMKVDGKEMFFRSLQGELEF
ncbi:transcription initiation factor IIA subunit 1, putative [Plasmodium malariae]|uniref:Transcription initiation factor IIA subunit 1, putative n=1 Tax=Plasmodium malariae TaxID=5858 RepID=A0A1A8X7Z9_PLAMA|nr:transcription initiation factor IIA subunit 1, putative [Plasmodium malariae]